MATLIGLTPVEEEQPLTGLSPAPATALEGLTPSEPPTGLTPVLRGVTAAKPAVTPPTAKPFVPDSIGDIDIESESAGNFDFTPPVQTLEDRKRASQHDLELKATRERVKEFEDKFTFMERRGIQLGKGYSRAAYNALVQESANMREQLRLIQNNDPDAMRRAGIVMPLEGGEAFGPSVEVAQTRRIAEIQNQLEQIENEMMAVGDAVHNPQIGIVNPRNVPDHPAMVGIQRAQEAGDQELVNKYMVEFFPELAAETALPSITQAGPAQLLVPGAIGALGKAGTGSTAVARGGFVAGTGVVSGHVESQASFVEFLQEQRVDLSNLESIQTALDDPKIVREGRDFALKRAASVAMWDMAGAYLATKNLMPPVLKNKFARQLGNTAAQIIQNPTASALGERTAQFAAGQDYNALEVKLEFLGEIPSAFTEPVVFHIADKIGKKPQELKTVKDILTAFVENPEITEAEALLALKEVASKRMTDAEAIDMLKSLPGFNWDAGTISAILDETASGIGAVPLDTKALPDSALVSALRKTVYETPSGVIQSGEAILDAESPTGNVWWSTDQMIDKPNNGIETTSSHTTMTILDEAIAQLEQDINIAKAGQAPDSVQNEMINQVEALKENRARIQRDIQEMAVIRPQLQSLLQEVINTFLPGHDIMVVEDNAITEYLNTHILGQTYHVQRPNGTRVNVIELNTRVLLDLQAAQKGRLKRGRGAMAMTTTLAHEVGHVLMKSLIRSLPKEVLHAMQAEHRIWLADQLKDLDKPFGEFLYDKKNPVEVKGFFEPIAAYMNERLADHPNLPYNLSFDEFVADQMERQLSSPNAKNLPTMIRKHLPRISRIMEAYYKKFKPTMQIDKTFDTFLTYLKAKSQREAMEHIRDSFTEAEQGMPSDPQGVVIMNMLNKKGLDVPAEIRDEVFASMDTYNKLMRYGVGILQLAKENKHIQGVQKYVQAVHEHWITKSSWNDQAMQSLNAWRRLGKKAGDELGRLFLAMTVESDKLGRALTNDETQALINDKKIDFGDKAPEAWQVYQRVKGDLANALQELYIIEKNRINQDWADVESQRKAKINELDTLFTQLRNRDYFPLSRFGEWGIAMKATRTIDINGRSYVEGETVHMELYENKRQRNKGQGQLARQYGPSVRATFFKVDDTLKPFTGLPMAVMRNLKNNPKLGLTPEQKDQLQDMIDTMSPTNSIAKRMLERKGTEGYSIDAQRGYANYMMQMGSHIAKMRHIGQMDDAITSVRKSAQYLGSRGLNNDKRHEIAEYLQRHQDYLLAPENEWGGLRALAFHWFLGYNPKSAIVNLTQVPLVAYPYLAARKELTGGTAIASDARAINSLVKNMKELGLMYDKNIRKMDLAKQQMFEQLVAEGIIDESLATELAGQAHSDAITRMMPKETEFTSNVHRGWQMFLRGSTWMFQTAEKYNRRVVAGAAYDLAREQGMNQEEAVSEAREALRTTQFEYARWNRAAFMRGKPGVFFVFMQYMQNVLYFVTRDPGKSRYLLMMLMAAGIQGLPGAEDLLDAIDYGRREWKRWTGYKDPWADSRADLRRMAITLNASPELIMHGLSAQSFGLGLPSVNDMLGTSIPSLTFEGSISAGRVIPGWETLMKPNKLSGVAAVEGAKDVLGAAITVPLNMLRWTRDEDPSSIRAFERMAPSALRGSARALRILNEGGLRDRSGKLITDFDMTNYEHIGELIGMAAGANPTRVARAQEARWQEREITEYYTQLRRRYLTDWFYAKEEARRTGDQEGQKDMLQRIKDYNKVAPKGQEIVNPAGAYIQFKKDQLKGEAGATKRLFDQPLVDEVRETFPAATEERIK